MLVMTDDRSGAAQLCRRWLERYPNAAEPYRLLGSIERAALRFTEAARLGEQAIARDPNNADYYLEAARAYASMSTPARLRQAAATLQRAIALKPRDPDARKLLGDVLQRLEQYDEARE